MMPLADLLADGPITAFAFRTGGGTSRAVRNFIAELAAVLSSTTKKPLIVASDSALAAIFRPFGYVDMRKVTGGKRFADIDGYDGSVYIELQHGADDPRSHDPCNIVLPENGKWDGGRTPENTVRSALPVFDSEAIYKGVAALLERWLETGKLVEVEPSRYESYEPEMTYGELDIGADPGDIDPADPRRKLPNWLDLVERIRALRRERGLSQRQGRPMLIDPISVAWQAIHGTPLPASLEPTSRKSDEPDAVRNREHQAAWRFRQRGARSRRPAA